MTPTAIVVLVLEVAGKLINFADTVAKALGVDLAKIRSEAKADHRVDSEAVERALEASKVLRDQIEG